MGMAIDKPGRHDHSIGVDNAVRRGPDASDFNDAAVRDADIRLVAGAARTIDNRSIFYE
jgi:hypothetical protein